MKNLSFLLFLLAIFLMFPDQGRCQQNFLPPFNFRVDSTTLLATWEAPKIVLLNEDFEGETFPPEGWSDTTLGMGWQCEDDPQFHAWWIVPEYKGRMALVNDDLNPVNNGSFDYLFTPALDLTVADSFELIFDSYFDGAYGQAAWLKYSPDGGTTWIVLQQMEPSVQWQRIEIDLAEFSGNEGISNFLLAFYANDRPDNFGWWASGWAVDNVIVHSGRNPLEVAGYQIFSDSVPIDTVEVLKYKYDIQYNSVRSCGINTLYAEGVSDTIWQVVRSYYLPRPEELTASYFNYYPPYHTSLKWYPPLGYQQEPPSESLTYQDQDQEISSGNRDVGDVILAFPAPFPISSCYGICDDGWNLWITDPGLSPTTIYQVN